MKPNMANKHICDRKGFSMGLWKRYFTSRLIFAAMLVGAAVSLPHFLQAQDTLKTTSPEPWYQTISLKGFLSSTYSYNFNKPASRMNQYRVFDFDDNTFKIDVAELAFERIPMKAGEAGFVLHLEVGASIPRIEAGSGLFRDTSGRGQDMDIQQAFACYLFPLGSGLRIDVGKFITHHGYESIEGYDGYDDNVTRSFLFGYAIPFTHTGIRASYTFNDAIFGTVMVVNGWDNVKDNNKSKSIGAQLGITPFKSFSLIANYMGGAERTENEGDLRHLLDMVASWKALDGLTLALNVDYGAERNALGGTQNAVWDGIAGYLRMNIFPHAALAFRGEVFNDRDGARTGVKQQMSGITVTPEYRLTPDFIIRVDVRTDKSDHQVFEKNGSYTDTQSTITFNALFLF